MRIGIPRECKVQEGRVALVPAACAELVSRGHEVFVEAGAGLKCGFDDEAFRGAGARISEGPDELYRTAEMVVKVKEPQESEYPRLRSDHLLFCFLHLAAAPGLTRVLLDTGLTAVGFETVDAGGRLPLLVPMSRIAGRLATQIGARLLTTPEGGKGILLGGLAGASRGRVVVLGGGAAGGSAAAVAAVLGAEVLLFDRDPDKLDRARDLGPNVTALYPYPDALNEAVQKADLLVGAVLIPGAHSPRLVGADVVRGMEEGSVIIDVSVDQGGCIETTRPTTYAEPTFVWEGVVHFGVTNMPGAVPRSASQALSAVLTPYVARLAEDGWRDKSPALAAGINTSAGRLVHPALRELETVG